MAACTQEKYSSNGFLPPLSTWEGNRKDGKIVLYRDSPAPNGTLGDYRLTFFYFQKRDTIGSVNVANFLSTKRISLFLLFPTIETFTKKLCVHGELRGD